MSKMSPKSPAFKPAPKPPKAPPLPGPSKIQQANAKLNRDEGGSLGGHSRSMHVGKSDTALKNRNIETATSFKSAHDQNNALSKAVGNSKLNSQAKTAFTVDSSKPTKTTALGTQYKGTTPIARVVTRDPNSGKVTGAFNAKVDQTTVVVKKGKLITTYPSGGTPLPKPASGPSLKPTTKANVKDIATGASGLRKVGAPAPKPLDLGNQKRFKGMTKNAK